MHKKQEIDCNIANCEYNDKENCRCMLEKIHVQCMNNKEPHTAKESMCANYKNCNCENK